MRLDQRTFQALPGRSPCPEALGCVLGFAWIEAHRAVWAEKGQSGDGTRHAYKGADFWITGAKLTDFWTNWVYKHSSGDEVFYENKRVEWSGARKGTQNPGPPACE